MKLLSLNHVIPAPLLPLRQDPSTRFLPFVMMMLSFLACLSLAATLMLAQLSEHWQSQLEDGMTVALPSLGSKIGTDTSVIEKADSLNQAALVKRLKETAGILSVTPVPDTEMRAMLRPLLSDHQANINILSDIALPMMFDVRIDQNVPINPDKLHKRLADIHPDIVVAPHEGMASTLTAPARLASAVGMIVIFVALVLCGLVIGLVARAGIRTHEPLARLLSLLGADDKTIVQHFQTHILCQSLPGTIAGLGLALLALNGAKTLFAAPVTAHAITTSDLIPGLDIRDWAMIAIMPLCLTALAVLVTGVIVKSSLSKSVNPRES